MKTGKIGAWLAGACLLIVVFAAWSLFMQLQIFSYFLLSLVWTSPAVAAFVTSSLSPNRKLLLGSSMAVVVAVLTVTLNFIFQIRGISVDFPGLLGGLILFTLALAGAAVLSLLGSIAGMLLTRNRR